MIGVKGFEFTKVDHEYAVRRSESHTKLDAQKRKIDGQPLYVLDESGCARRRRPVPPSPYSATGVVTMPADAKEKGK